MVLHWMFFHIIIGVGTPTRVVLGCVHTMVGARFCIIIVQSFNCNNAVMFTRVFFYLYPSIHKPRMFASVCKDQEKFDEEEFINV